MESFFVATPDDAGERLDAYLSKVSELTRSAAVRLIESGDVLVGGEQKDKKYKLKDGDRVEVFIPEPEILDAEPQDIPIDVIYEDSDVIVINKPSGMVVHPAPGNPDGTLVNALLYHCRGSLSGIGGKVRPGIVHRIDKDTSGLLVVAKNDESHAFLSEKMKTHDVRRVYYAVALGNIKEDSGKIDLPIGRHPVDRKKMAVIKDASARSREAITNFEVLERFRGFTFVKCKLETGRTHQIRVHLSAKGHPLLGDTVYGGGNTAFEKHNKALIDGQCLHAGELSFLHPRTRELMTFKAEMPENMSQIIEKLRKITNC